MDPAASASPSPLAERVDRLDQLVHYAAAIVPGPLTETDAADLQRSVAVNGLALVSLVREAGALLQAGSSVVSVSSQGARQVIRGYGSLGIAKAPGEHAGALPGRRARAARHPGQHGLPGMLDTKAVRAMFPDSYEKVASAAARSNPSQRALEFEDVAAVVEYICGRDLGMAQGQLIGVDGGASLR